jgi:hypothetical protein
MREGIWPVGVEAARGSHRTFRPLDVYPEFRSVDAANGKPDEVKAAAPTGRKSSRNWQVLLSTGFGVGLLAAAALCRILLTL